jgi:hypothetical protein
MVKACALVQKWAHRFLRRKKFASGIDFYTPRTSIFFNSFNPHSEKTIDIMADEVYDGAIGIDLGKYNQSLTPGQTFSFKAGLFADFFYLDRNHLLLRYVLESFLDNTINLGISG